MKIREEINEMDTKQKTATTKINKTMLVLCKEKYYRKIKLTNRKRQKTQINKIRGKRKLLQYLPMKIRKLGSYLKKNVFSTLENLKEIYF